MMDWALLSDMNPPVQFIIQYSFLPDLSGRKLWCGCDDELSTKKLSLSWEMNGICKQGGVSWPKHLIRGLEGSATYCLLHIEPKFSWGIGGQYQLINWAPSSQHILWFHVIYIPSHESWNKYFYFNVEIIFSAFLKLHHGPHPNAPCFPWCLKTHTPFLLFLFKIIFGPKKKKPHPFVDYLSWP